MKKRIPPGQRVTEKFPVLHVDRVPEFDPSTWRLRVNGAVRKRMILTWNEFLDLPRVKMTSDFHCVTGWSRLDNEWEGVRFSVLIGLVRPVTEVESVLFTSDDGYTTSLPLWDLKKDEVLLACGFEGRSLPPEHGGPLRLIVPKKYAYKSAKWIREITFLEEHVRGYWEKRGYSDGADPWKEERYSR